MYIPNSNPKWLVNGMLSDGLWLGLRRSLTRNWPNHTKSLRDLGDSSGTRSRRSWSSRPWSLPLCKYAWNFTSWPTWRSKSSEDLPKLKPMLTTKNPPWSRKPPIDANDVEHISYYSEQLGMLHHVANLDDLQYWCLFAACNIRNAVFSTMKNSGFRQIVPSFSVYDHKIEQVCSFM